MAGTWTAGNVGYSCGREWRVFGEVVSGVKKRRMPDINDHAGLNPAGTGMGMGEKAG
jgi:hypothetical protein